MQLCPITNINLRKLKLDDFSSLNTNTKENLFSTSRLLTTAANLTMTGNESSRSKKNIVKTNKSARIRRGLTKAKIMGQLMLGANKTKNPSKNSLFKKQRENVLSKAIRSRSKLGNSSSEMSDVESPKNSTATVKM